MKTFKLVKWPEIVKLVDSMDENKGDYDFKIQNWGFLTLRFGT